MWHMAAYKESIGNTANDDMNAVADSVFTVRNNHLIFTDRMNLIGVYGFGALLSRARFGNAALTRLGSNHIWPIEVSATVPDLPQMMDLRDSPLMLPKNEELTIEVTNTAAGPTETGAVLCLADPLWTMGFPSHRDRLVSRATCVIAAGTETTWTALSELTFERDLYNGVYAVVGASVVAANAIAARFRFPDQPQTYNKQFRPGCLVQDSAALAPNPAFMGGFGEWGRFHTFSPPEMQVLADAAGGTYEVRLSLLYLGEDDSLLNAG